MKKYIFSLLIIILTLGLFSHAFSIEKNLINFDTYEANLMNPQISGNVYPRTDPRSQQNNARQINQVTGIPQYTITVADMLVKKWLVMLNSSANSIAARRYSMCKLVRTRGVYGGRQRNVLGARIHFHRMPYSAWAIIMPPFEIVAFNKKGKFVNVQNGVIDNTGQLYQISIEVNGRNYNNSISIRMKDSMEKTTDYFMGYVYFAGWKRLIWKNPNYIENVDLRTIFRLPLYPRSIPYKKLVGFVVYRQGYVTGGDFIIYIAGVKVAYDKAVFVEEMDVDDEQVWRIISQQQEVRAEIERRRNAELIELRRQEQRRQHNSETIRRRTQQEDQQAIQQAQRGGGQAATQPPAGRRQGAPGAQPAQGARPGAGQGGGNQPPRAPATPPGGN